MGKDMEKTEYAIKQVGDRYYPVITDREAGGHYEIKNPLTGGILSYNNAEAAETYIKRSRDEEQARRAYVKAEETAKRSGLE
jgi:hypothetical protein